MADPTWNEWAFWLKDPESVRNLALTFASMAAVVGGTVGIVLATVRSVASMKQARAASEGQVTKLLTDAIGFLADKEKLELRLGAIYALERIAQASKADRFRILEILYFFLREGTARRMAESSVTSTPIAPDVQACLDVIARNPPPRVFFGRRTARLTLANVDLRNVDLQGARLRRVHLPGADLRGANLGNADLRGANLIKANLQGAKLQSCRLNDAKVSEANLRACQLESANLTSAKMDGANFDQANLHKASLDKADLRGATFIEASLAQASFGGADLFEAKFINADIAGTDFRHRRETGGTGHAGSTEIYRTNLSGVDFTGANRDLAVFEDDDTMTQRKFKNSLTNVYRRLLRVRTKH